MALLALGCVVALALLASDGDASAGQLPVDLRASGNFAVLAGTTVTNSGFSTLNGDVGVSPGSALTGFPPGKVINGTTHAADPVAGQAQTDLTTAYNDAAGRTPPNALPADVGGRTLPPGVYKSGTELGLTGVVTLDAQGDPNAVFIFQIGSKLTTAVSSRVDLIGGAQASNVFWQVGSSATLGTSSVFAGTILAYKSISMRDGVTLNGRALARNGAVTLINDMITVPRVRSFKASNKSVIHYAALGDSYSSGEGLGGVDDEGYLDSVPGEPGKGDHRACHRHQESYPVLTSNYEGHPVNLDLFAACTGARTEHIYKKGIPTQHGENLNQAQSITALATRPNLISITIGGNDIGEPDKAGNGGLGQLLLDCYKATACEETYRKRVERRLRELPPKLYAAYEEIRLRAPKAVIVVLGYPRPFPTDRNKKRLAREQSCARQAAKLGPYDGFAPAEQDFMNDGVNKLNKLIGTVVEARRKKAGDRRIYFDRFIAYEFTGHSHCDKNGLEPWTNGITGANLGGQPLSDVFGLGFVKRPGSFHPNKAGHMAYGNQLYGFLCQLHFLGVQRQCSKNKK